MTREAKTYPLWGNKLYHKRARSALPILVRQAKAAKEITYEDLAGELGMSGPWATVNLSYPLGTIGDSLIKLGREWQQDIPQIQTFAVRKDTGFPGSGIAEFLGHSKTAYEALSSQQLRQLIKGVQKQAHEFPRWNEVLRVFGLEPTISNATLVNTAKDYRGRSGESDDHRRLKNYVRDHPHIVGLRHTNTETEVERKLPSGDILDVSFKSSLLWTAVEVKSVRSSKDDLTRGVFQYIKYEAVMAAELVGKGRRRKDFEVKAILAVEGKLESDTLGLAHTLGVDVREIPVGIYRT